MSVVVATPKVSIQNGVGHHEVVILEPPESSPAIDALALQLSLNLENHMIVPKRTRWGQQVDYGHGEFISLIELSKPLLDNISDEDFTAIQKLMSSPSKLLWVTSLDTPAGALAAGMARSIRNEIAGKQFRTLSVQESSMKTTERLAQLIAQLAISQPTDSEFLEEDGVLKTCRVVEDAGFDDQVSHTLVEAKDRIESIPLEQAVGAQKLAIYNIGMLDSICLEKDDHAAMALANDEVEIEVKATGLK